MMGTVTHPGEIDRFLGKITTAIISWLHAQLDTLRAPEGILLLDDIVGMVSLKHYQALVAPHLQRIFTEFDGLLKIYHNDTPCAHLYGALADAGFDVFNFSHEVDITDVKNVMGHRVAVMGNIAPLDLGVRGTPQEVEQAALACLDEAGPGGGMILSFGGGVSPGTPADNIDALLRAARTWRKRSSSPEVKEY
jgi:uroporphyrinogen decarboxylase